MTTSLQFTKTAGDIITEALRDARIIPVEQPVQAIDFERGLSSLNNVSVEWQNDDINLWLERTGVLPLNVGQPDYLLGPNGAPCGYEDEFFQTDLGADQVTNDTALTAGSTLNMVAAPDILQSDPTVSTQDWTAINSATLAVSSGIEITNGAATDGGAEYTLDVTPGQTYRVRFGFTLGTSVSCVFSVLNGVTVDDTVTLSASTASTELTITAVNDTITFRAQNTSVTIGETSIVASLNYVDDKTGSVVGIQMDDDTRFWTYVLNVNSSTLFDITDGLPSDSAENNCIYFFTTQIARPVRLLRKGCTYAPDFTASEIPVSRWARSQYLEQPDKLSQGTINQWTYDRRLNEGRLSVWQVAGNVNNLFRFNHIVPATVYSDAEDALVFPSEYYMALKWAIAADVGPSYGIPENRQTRLETKALEFHERALAHDVEMDEMILQPDFN